MSTKSLSNGAGDHCWHSMGLASGDDSGGSDTFKCCQCGEVDVIMAVGHKVQVHGHGPHHTAIQYQWKIPKGTCEAR